VLPDQGLYEERYRLTGAVAASVAFSLVTLGLAVHGVHDPVWLALSVLAFVTVTLPIVTAAVTRKVAFRVDPLGVTLGGDPMSWTRFGNGSVFIPWTDVEKIVIYPAGTDRQCVGIQRHASAPPLPQGNRPARRCPVPGVAEGATRQTVAWRLDRERLNALVAAVAPAIPVIDTVGAPVEGAGTAAVEGAGTAAIGGSGTAAIGGADTAPVEAAGAAIEGAGEPAGRGG
jgi:hypothetical protein